MLTQYDVRTIILESKLPINYSKGGQGEVRGRLKGGQVSVKILLKTAKNRQISYKNMIIQ